MDETERIHEPMECYAVAMLSSLRGVCKRAIKS